MQIKLQNIINTLNGKMGNFRNYIKTAQTTIENKIEEIQVKMYQIEEYTTQLREDINQTLQNTREELEKFGHKISYFQATMDEKVDTASTRLKQHTVLQEANLSSTHALEQRHLFQQNIKTDIENSIQEAIHEHILPLIEKMKKNGENSLLNIEAMHNKLIQDIEECMQNLSQIHQETIPYPSSTIPTQNLQNTTRDRYGKIQIRTSTFQ